MAKLLFAKIELWVVALLALLGMLGTIAFGTLVLDGASDTPSFGAASRAAVNVASIPETVSELLSPADRVRIWNGERFADQPTGWSKPASDLPRLPGYLLLSRYDGTERRHRVELLSLQDWQVRHVWSPDGAALLDGVSTDSNFIDTTTWNTSLFRAIHPLLLPNGDMIVKDHYSPLFRIDSCGKRLWFNAEKVFHHSTEADADGNLWIPSLVEPQEVRGVTPEFAEDELLKLDLTGKILFRRSLPQLFEKYGLEYLLFTNGRYNSDPTHLNDIEPVLTDGAFWKAGDVFLSLRNISTIMLYRPSTDEIVWWKQGPWMAQHDVDIVGPTAISVYDNHAEDRGKVEHVREHSNVMVYDFATDTVTLRNEPLMASLAVKTLFAGLYSELPGGYALIEDVTDARLVVAGPDGLPVASFVNRAENGFIYQLGWSRYIDQQTGDAALEAIKGVTCND